MHEIVSYDCPSCAEEIELQMEIDEGGIEGTDADGNRGWYYGPAAIAPDLPDCCPHCGYEPTPAELIEINAKLEQYANEWRPASDPWDNPQYD